MSKSQRANKQRPRLRSHRDIEDQCAFDLAIGSIFQNEAPYLKEWIEWHKMMGVQQFILVNDRSTDNFEDVLNPYIHAGEVVLCDHPCPSQFRRGGWNKYQLEVMSSLINQMRFVSRWLALIDIDEYIVPLEADNLVTFLGDYEDCGGIYIRWEPFGTSYVERLSDSDLLTERLRMKWRFIEGHEMLGKSIVKPHRVRRPNIHRCDLLPGYHYIDSNPKMKSRLPRIKINHYWSKDEYFLINVKLPRIARSKGWRIDQRRIEMSRHIFNDVVDESMERFIPELRRRVFHSD